MAGLNPFLYILGLIYLSLLIFLIFYSKKFADKTKSNPLKESFTEEDSAQFFYKTKNSFSYNLRYLMKDYKCKEYKEKIINLKDGERQLSRVFSFDLSFINNITNIYYYSLIGCTIFFGISYIMLCFYCCIKSDECLTCLGCLFVPCLPCMSIILMIYGVANLVLLVVFFYHYFWGSINDFVQFLDCSIVNRTYMMLKYSKIVDLKKDIKIFLILLGVNFFFCFLYGIFSFKQKDEVKRYHSEFDIDIHKDNANDDNVIGVILIREEIL